MAQPEITASAIPRIRPYAFLPLVDLKLARKVYRRVRAFDVPLDLRGTAFQRQVWQALCEIPHGETRSYGEIAARIGSEGGSRAVGLANHENPVPLIVPCHRVINADGTLGGFGGGVELKRWLLRHEGAEAAAQSALPW